MSPEEVSALLLSLKVGVTAVVVSLPFAVAIAYVLARRKFPGRLLVQGIVDLPLVLPPVVTGYLLLMLFAPNGVLGQWLDYVGIRIAFTWFGAAIASAVVSFPLMVRAIRGAIQSVDQRYELTARSLGASRWSTFWLITIPLSRHGIVAGCLLAFARSVGEFGATILLAGDIPGQTRTIPLAIYSMGQRVDGLQQSWRLVLLSIGLSVAALIIGECFERARGQHEFN
ncbi:MAG: molybdate ABC transporter permease subunit [Planctomycetota bacterium]